MNIRNIPAVLLAAVLCLSLAACGTSGTMTVQEAAVPASATATPAVSAAPSEAATSSSDAAGISAENRVRIEDTLQAIYDVQPGSAGCSLRTMIAAGKLLDLAETLTDRTDASELAHIAYEWKQNNDKIPGAFDEAYPDVREIAFDYLDHPDAYQGRLEDCGYAFTHDTHTLAYLEYVTNYIEISRATGE